MIELAPVTRVRVEDMCMCNYFTETETSDTECWEDMTTVGVVNMTLLLSPVYCLLSCRRHWILMLGLRTKSSAACLYTTCSAERCAGIPVLGVASRGYAQDELL